MSTDTSDSQLVRTVVIGALFTVGVALPSAVAAQTADAESDGESETDEEAKESPSDAPTEQTADDNAPPEWGKVYPSRYASGEIEVSHDETVEFFIDASDPNHDTVTLEAEALPEGASFDPESGEFSWDPSPDDAGPHVARFTATDGDITVRRRVYIRIRDNQPPGLGEGRLTFKPAIEQTRDIEFQDRDHADSDIRVTSTDALPDGAELVDDGRAIRWKPKPEQIGTHEVELTLTDGVDTAARSLTLLVEEDPEYQTRQGDWDSYFLPGAKYTFFAQRNGSSYRYLHGASVEFTLYAWGEFNANEGPSHGRFYLGADILQPVTGRGTTWVFASAGLQMSLERAPERRWLIPVFGLESGYALVAGTNAFHVTPTLGLHLFADRNKFFTLSGGYTLPTYDIDRNRGIQASLGATVTFW